MTREEAIEVLKEQARFLKSDFSVHINLDDALAVAIKALEQESVLDKIIAEIIDIGAYEQEVNGKTEFLKGINYCLDVIDKYKAESEE